MNLTVMQFFATWIGVFAGRSACSTPTTTPSPTNYRTQFLNFGLNISPPPWHRSRHGWGTGGHPMEGRAPDRERAGSERHAADNSFDDAFDGGVLIGSEGPVTIRPFGLVGHQLSPPGFHTASEASGSSSDSAPPTAS
jgi:hypothetical protein